MTVIMMMMMMTTTAAAAATTTTTTTTTIRKLLSNSLLQFLVGLLGLFSTYKTFVYYSTVS